MENEILNDIKAYAVKKLNKAYGYCSEASNDRFSMLNSDDGKGSDIKITFKLEARIDL